ncbi:MAG: hypothetical protein AAFN11_18250 [Chloroflexota bacterium]
MNQSRFAQRAWKLIQRNPASIAINRDGIFLSDQTVRVETSNAQVERTGVSGAMATMRDAVVFGIRNHPSVSDTDIKRNDRFEHEGQDYRVMDVNFVVGGLQAHCEVIS